LTAKTIALLQQKGGSGKTTTAMNIAGGLIEKGYSVMIADMDSDKPDAWSWGVKGQILADRVRQIEEKTARDQVNALKKQCDFVIIDTPPNFQTAALKAALLADLVVIPAAPSGMDLSGLMEAKDLALTADRAYRLLGNRIAKNTTMGQSLLKILEEDGNAFQACIPQSIKFVEAEAEGLYIGEYAPDSIPHFAVQQLADELCHYFALPIFKVKTQAPMLEATQEL
jgi:chromosome partitioning protein